MMIPGRALHRLAARICSEKTLERVVEPALADLQKEYRGADASSVWRRAWIVIAGYSAILKAMAICAVSVSVAATDERRALIATLIWSCLIFVAATVLLLLPPLSIVEGKVSSEYLIQLLPQAVPLAIPVGVAFGVAFGMAGRTATRSVTKIILLSAVFASLVSFMTLAWAMPAGNQAYRESVARAAGHSGPLRKGFSEMTLSELDREAVIAASAGDVHLANQFAWSFHFRFALAAANLVLAGFVVVVGSRRVVLRSIGALVLCLAYWALIFTGEFLSVYRTVVPTFAGAWLPNLVLIATAVVIVSSRSSRLRASVVEAPH